MRIRILQPLLIVAGLFTGGCATQIKTEVTQNPPPMEKFSNLPSGRGRPVGS
jgi:hypothetical protein